jgi:hypothetical protein
VSLRPYNDPTYRAARAWLSAHPDTLCHFAGCSHKADTIDHVPALVEHQHVRGSRCCTLHPACRLHNFGHGGRLARARERTPEPRTPW